MDVQAAASTSRFVASIRNLSKRSARDEARSALVEGRSAIEYALRMGALTRLAVDENKAPKFEDLVSGAMTQGAQVRSVTERCMRSISDTPSPQGILGVAACDFAPKLPDAQIVVVLAGVQDPGNVGTIVRCADAFGAAVAIGPGTADPRSEKVVRASAGSVLGVPIAKTNDLEAIIWTAQGQGARVIAADMSGDTGYFGDDRSAVTASTWWVFGNEAHGLPPELLAACSEVAAIPMMGNAESLNVGASAAVCLHWTRSKLGYPK